MAADVANVCALLCSDEASFVGRANGSGGWEALMNPDFPLALQAPNK